jgi:hypothetical protein
VKDQERQEAERILDRLSVRYGPEPRMRRKLLPIVVRILQTGPPGKKRQALLRLVVEAYAHHVRVRDTIHLLRARLRQHLNDAYGDMLGIEPPRVGY